MPTAAPLIAKRLLAQAAERTPPIDPTTLHLATAWARTAAGPAFQLQTEKSQQGKFLADVFGRLLGYRQFVEATDGAYAMRAESASKQTRGNQTPDAILGQLGGDAAAEHIAAVVELKAPTPTSTRASTAPPTNAPPSNRPSATCRSSPGAAG